MLNFYQTFISKFNRKNHDFFLMKETNNAYETEIYNSRTNSEKKNSIICCCIRKNSKTQSVLANSREMDLIENYNPVLYSRDSRNNWSTSAPNEGDAPFLNYTSPGNYQLNKPVSKAYNSVLVDYQPGIEQEKQTYEQSYHRSTSPIPINRKKERSRNFTECNVTHEESRLLYNKAPSFFEIVENPTSSTFKQVREAKLQLLDVERKRLLERMPSSSKESVLSPGKPLSPEKSKEKSSFESQPCPEKLSVLSPEGTEELYEESPGKSDTRSVYGVHTKHCIACIIESMKRLPDCCLKKALYLNPIYISNDCPSKPVYLQ